LTGTASAWLQFILTRRCRRLGEKKNRNIVIIKKVKKRKNLKNARQSHISTVDSLILALGEESKIGKIVAEGLGRFGYPDSLGNEAAHKRQHKWSEKTTSGALPYS
jgi:hypothetical protein